MSMKMLQLQVMVPRLNSDDSYLSKHWDYVSKNRIGFLEGCATECILRYVDSGQEIFLDNAICYLNKLIYLSKGGFLPNVRELKNELSISFYKDVYGLEEIEIRVFFLLLGSWKNHDLDEVYHLIDVLLLKHS